MTTTATVVRPRDRYAAVEGRVQLTGIQALARLPIEQARRDRNAGLDTGTFISGYEGSPLAGYDLELNRIRDLLDANAVTFVPGLNEEAAATSVQGSQLAPTVDGANCDGVLGIWYGKAPGLDRATDALRHGNLMGAHPCGGALVLVGDDPAAKSSSVPCASEFALADLAMPFLYPGDSAEVLELGLHAVELSRASGLWVGVKVVTSVADGTSTVDLGDERPEPVLPAGAKRHVPTARLLQPTLGPLERDQLTTRLRIAREYARLNDLNRTVGRGTADRLGIVSAGRTYLDVVTALEKLGIAADALEASPIRLLKVVMPYPLDEQTLREFATGLDEVVVVEEKRSFLATALRDALYDLDRRPVVTGKADPGGAELFPAYGELDVDLVVARLGRRLAAHGLAPAGDAPDRSPAAVAADRSPAAVAGRTQLPLLRRTPYFCSGCPHNTSTKPLDGSLTGAGIGCHAMVLLMDEGQVGTVTGLSQMGGEGLQWIGMAPFVHRSHYVQNLGDGTFDHSGSLAIRAAVAAGVNITYKLLYNSAVAMTGGQRPAGGMTVAQVVDVLRAEGVARVIVTTEDASRYRRNRLPAGVAVWDRSRFDEAQRVLAATPGVTVLVHDQECATERRRRRRRSKDERPETRVVIDERICEGCGDCGRTSNCLSVQPVATEFGRKTAIHQGSCNLDYSCVDGDCPAFLTVTVPAGGRGREGVADIDAAELPDPPVAAQRDGFSVRLAGVGGTGVVTASQILATAGLLAGWNVRSLDQTGLAQKGGAVVSDVRFRRTGHEANKLAAGECDLYLGCDLLVAADPAHLAVAAPGRTTAVLSVAELPTGRMVSDVSVTFPDVDELADRVRAGARTTHLLDARELTTALFGDDQYANLFLVGAGFQAGGLPLPAAAVEEAIRRGGVAVEANLQAFRRGRQYVVEPEVVTALAATRQSRRPAATGTLADVVALRVAELTDYQNTAYAARYAARVEQVRRAEAAVDPSSTVLTETVARNLHKLMAYKDEYEVARLALLPQTRAEIEERFGPGARASWNLHPPVLRALGMKRKLRLGPWFRVVFRVLRALRGLRGTAFDPFGRAHVRRAERDLVREYGAVVDELAARLDAATLQQAVRVAGLPDVVRGYEDLKLATIERYRTELDAAMTAFRRP
ncbi:indolepyruvate ferredoxin oxidoreductase family protein [Jiangella ureilytica]|uniref:indolepyruvate ferredoxin oxidoreductase family protein n=1 Tax=Jiangella ureilytica TaxID=2530374 RepID=UPI00193DB403|nr:indolepyruvate ferredoxin oxidoreductase family protein [Jiangella ureilytica]